jgi:hypothetical protein
MSGLADEHPVGLSGKEDDRERRADGVGKAAPAAIAPTEVAGGGAPVSVFRRKVRIVGCLHHNPLWRTAAHEGLSDIQATRGTEDRGENPA